jgi:acetyl-CoA/propionyl-CoA carboxylase, biotin carboxylase, biotin carboxyl carrier protein
VEYLVQGDTVSFLEVNTRLQVEHPVTEETAGIDLVRQQFRIAAGERLNLTEDPAPRGRSFEFRINGEDPGRGFLPGPGPVRVYRAPSGPGVRVDSGVESGSVIGGQFDSMLAKLIVTGENRTQALERARRALAEFEIEGLATLLPFHRHIVEHPTFIGSVDDNGAETFGVYTKWIETEWENTHPPYTPNAPIDGPGEARQTITVEVDGRRVEVTLPGGLAIGGVVADRPTQANTVPSGAADADADEDAVTAPMQGTVIKVAVEDGQQVAEGDLVVVLEAMKMENPVTAHKAGVVTGLAVQPGSFVTQGAPIAQLK